MFANKWTHSIADLAQEREKNLTRINAGIRGLFRDKGLHIQCQGPAETAHVFSGVILFSGLALLAITQTWLWFIQGCVQNMNY